MAAVVRMDGEMGRPFTVKMGVRQGCVIAPTLFNVLVDHILQQPLSQLPLNKNSHCLLLSRAVHCRQISHIVALLYADNLAVLADSPDDLVVVVGMVDAIAPKYGLFINAA
eukprot:365856-Chlamydomonas_euryale.AAC.5